MQKLLKEFQKLQEQRDKDAEVIKAMKEKIEEKEGEEKIKEELDHELEEINAKEKVLEDELENLREKKKAIQARLLTEDVTGRPKKAFDTVRAEERISLAFGGDQNCTAQHLRQFISHYELVRMINIRNTIVNWDDPKYRAAKLRISLLGSPAEFMGEESSMSRAWTFDDDQIIQKLKERYIDTESIELKIMEAEEVTQEENEPLSEYMTRVQRKMRDAYPEEPDTILNKRVAWKFLSGIRNREIRAAVIKDKWMVGQEAKPLDEILLIAESTRKAMVMKKDQLEQ